MEIEEQALRTHDPLEQQASFRGLSLRQKELPSVEAITVEVAQACLPSATTSMTFFRCGT